MAEILGIKEIEARKRALVAESEVYRETLKLEIQNVRLYKARIGRNFAIFRLANPAALFLGSLVASRFLGSGRERRKPRGKWSRIIGGLLVGWRLYRNFGPLLHTILRNRTLMARRRHPPQEEQFPAANI
jgi:hypothetical protein